MLFCARGKVLFVSGRNDANDVNDTLPETNSSPLKIDPWKRRCLLETIIFGCYVSFREGISRIIQKGTRWAPTSYKWSYNPYKWPYNWVTGVITLLVEVITPLITSRGPTLYIIPALSERCLTWG